MSALRVVFAPDSFKGTATSIEAAAALAAGWRDVRDGDELVELPMADGGEGTLDALAAAQPGAQRHTVTVQGPDGRPATAAWLWMPDGTAVVELAQSSGLPLLAELDPLGAGTFGLGQVCAAALDAGARRLVIGLGGSAGTDGGAGCLAALGARFADQDGQPVGPGGGSLARLATVDLSAMRPPPPDGIECLVDVSSPLLGPNGAAAVFGPQKGADPGQVQVLDGGLARLAGLLGGDPTAAGAGAAGGTAYGLAAGWGARLVPGAPTVALVARLPEMLGGAALLVSGEGRFDQTSLAGKVVGHLADLADAAGVPIAVVAGQVAAPQPAHGRTLSLTDLSGDGAAARADPLRWLRTAGANLAREQADSPR